MKMNQEKARLLVSKYNSGQLQPEEEELLEQYIEQGWIQLEELEDIQTVNTQLNQFFDHYLSSNMRNEFQQMLEAEKTRQSQETPIWAWIRQLFDLRPTGSSLAFGSLLLLLGLVIGYGWPGKSQGSQQEITQLSTELQEMRELMMLALLEKESTSERLKAVNLTQEMDDASDQVTQALLKTLNEDENVNVRLAALEALYAYAHYPSVREGLIKSIQHQESPLVQLSLAEVMVSLQEKRSLKAFEELLEKGNVPPPVKEKIQENIQVLL